MRRNKKKFISKYEAQKVHISSTVIKIEEQNVLIKDKYKTVFYCQSQTQPEGRMCIAWGRTRIIVGSKVELDGRFKDDVFLVWKITITNQKALEFEPNPHTEQIKSKLKELKKMNFQKIKEGKNEQSTN